MSKRVEANKIGAIGEAIFEAKFSKFFHCSRLSNDVGFDFVCYCVDGEALKQQFLVQVKSTKNFPGRAKLKASTVLWYRFIQQPVVIAFVDISSSEMRIGNIASLLRTTVPTLASSELDLFNAENAAKISSYVVDFYEAIDGSFNAQHHQDNCVLQEKIEALNHVFLPDNDHSDFTTYFSRYTKLWERAENRLLLGYPIHHIKRALKGDRREDIENSFLMFLYMESDAIHWVKDEITQLKSAFKYWELYEALRAACLRIHQTNFVKNSDFNDILAQKISILMTLMFGEKQVEYASLLSHSFDPEISLELGSRPNTYNAVTKAFDSLRSPFNPDAELRDQANEKAILASFVNPNVNYMDFIHLLSWNLRYKITTTKIRSRLMRRFDTLICKGSITHPDLRVRFDCLLVMDDSDHKELRSLLNEVAKQISQIPDDNSTEVKSKRLTELRNDIEKKLHS